MDRKSTCGTYNCPADAFICCRDGPANDRPSLPVQFVLLNSHSNRNVMQRKECFHSTRPAVLCQAVPLGQKTAFVPKCNTVSKAEEKCNREPSLPNEIRCFFYYNSMYIPYARTIPIDRASKAGCPERYRSAGFPPGKAVPRLGPETDGFLLSRSSEPILCAPSALCSLPVSSPKL